ncbi:MAG: hypothetical protein H6579_04565 [Chitinophagales bacterium]|nr:hypothetical protein [Chitinophagales bacterium]
MKIKEEILLYKEDNIFNYSYGNYLSNGVLIIFVLLIFIGTYLLFSKIALGLNLLGVLFVIAGIAAFVPQELMQIDFKERRFRKSIKVFHLLYSEDWKSLENVKYLSIVRIKTSIHIKDSDYINNPENQLIESKLRFFIKPGYNITIDHFKKKKSAIYIGSLIAKGLNLNLLDACLNPPEFIEL